jgi:hypothetical protein
MCRVHLSNLDGERDEILAGIGGVQGVSDPAQRGPAGCPDRIRCNSGQVEFIGDGRLICALERAVS